MRIETKVESEGLAQLTAELLREGTEKHNGIEILEGFERLGSSIEAGADWDSTVVSMTLLRNHLITGASPVRRGSQDSFLSFARS